MGNIFSSWLNSSFSRPLLHGDRNETQFLYSINVHMIQSLEAILVCPTVLTLMNSSEEKHYVYCYIIHNLHSLQYNLKYTTSYVQISKCGLVDDNLLLRDSGPYGAIFMNVRHYNHCHGHVMGFWALCLYFGWLVVMCCQGILDFVGYLWCVFLLTAIFICTACEKHGSHKSKKISNFCWSLTTKHLRA